MVERASVLLRRRSPLHDLAAEMEAAGGPAVRLREIPFLAQIGLRATPGSEAQGALAGALGTDLPSSVGGVANAADGASIIWMSPDEFLLVAPDEVDGGPDPARLTAQLSDALGDRPGQVVDLSANRTTLQLSWDKAQEVLDKSCRLDLDLRAFPAGTALVTLLGNVGVILWRMEPDTWRVLPRSSFAPYVARWLMDGMREYAA